MIFNKLLKFSVALLIIAGIAVPQLSANEVFESKCGKCHKLNGKGKEKGPDLTGFAKKRPAEYLSLYSATPAKAREKFPDIYKKEVEGKYKTEMKNIKLSSDELKQVMDAMK